MLSPTVHGVIDYASVGLLALAPSLFGLVGLAASLAYALAGIHLAMTVMTRFPPGLIKVVPLRLHGLVELVVGLSLTTLPTLLSRVVELGDHGRVFYTGFGLVLIFVYAVTDYG